MFFKEIVVEHIVPSLSLGFEGIVVRLMYQYLDTYTGWTSNIPRKCLGIIEILLKSYNNTQTEWSERLEKTLNKIVIDDEHEVNICIEQIVNNPIVI